MNPEDVLFLFAPGAGAPSSSAWMRAWAARLATVGTVETFDYGYMRERRKRPDPLPVLIAAHRAALAEARGRHGGTAAAGPRVILAGKSMGSRVGCHVSLEEPQVAGVVCFGYPLRAAGSGKMRDAVLVEMRAPVLFVQGTRDELCPLEDLAAVRARMTARSELYIVDRGDHSLAVTKTQQKASGMSQEAVDAGVLARVREFVESVSD
jgi:uncharacterized protein